MLLTLPIPSRGVAEVGGQRKADVGIRSVKSADIVGGRFDLGGVKGNL
jgi:hypothetical protein